MAELDRASNGLNGGLPTAPAKGIPDHELLRCIGRGSYGDVWLGKSVMGTYRAIKIVYRKNFEEAHPYEREFKGIQKFEPVSRSHEGFVDILQVGRNDEEGYFYYIMELGDDQHSGDLFDPARFTPKTLASERARRGRLSFQECLQLGVALASALAQLHRQGLVHRDVKPSNIIFVQGVPKLADIGLVAEAGEARSFVGTEGFIPPEGPGGPQADIYSLGKVLYEICTGKDRQQFPSLPPDWGETEQAPFRELNEVILKACETEVSLRYASAVEMLEDVEVLRQGKSVKRLRLLERRWALVTRVGAVSGLVLLLAGVTGYLIRREYRKEAELRLRQAQSLVAYGARLMEEGDLFGALPRFAEALRLEQKDPVRARTHRVRIAALNRHCPQLEQCRVLEQAAFSGSFSPDGRWLATVDADGAVQVYGVSDGKMAPEKFFHGPGKGARTVRFSPDGEVLLTAGSDAFARRWDWKEGKELLPALEHPAEVYSAEFSPDGTRLVTSCGDYSAWLWDVATARKLRRFQGHGDHLLYAAFSPDGKKVITASQDFSAWIWDADTGQPGPRLWHKSWVYYASFSADGRYAASASFDNTAQVWDAATGRRVLQPLMHPAGVASAEFSPDVRYLVTAGFDFAARVWDLKTGELSTPPLDHGGQVMYSTFSPDGRSVLSIARDRTVRLWNLEVSNWLPPTTTATFCQTGQRCFLLSNRVVSVSKPRGGQVVGQMQAPGAVLEVVPNRAGSHVLLVFSSPPSSRSAKSAQLWDVARLAPVGPAFAAQTGMQWTLSEDGQRAIGTWPFLAQLWDAPRGQFLYVISNQVASFQKTIFAPDGDHFALLSSNRVLLFATKTGKPLAPLVHACKVAHAEFSPDGRKIVAACSDDSLEPRSAQVWSVADGKPLSSLPHKDGVLYATFSPDGRYIATAGEDFTARLWNAQSGQELGPPLRHGHQVFAVQFSRDGRWVATASRDGSARVWDVATGSPITPPLRHPGAVRQAQFIGEPAEGVLTRIDGGITYSWELPADGRPLDEIISEAEFQSGQSLSGQGILDRARQTALLGRWAQLKAETVRAEQPREAALLAWHERQAESAERRNQSFAALFHLNRLIAAPTPPPAWLARRGAVHADLGHWSEAEADYRQALGAGLKSVPLLCAYARVCLMAGNTNLYLSICQELNRLCPLKDQKMANQLTWTLALAPAQAGDYTAALDLAAAAAGTKSSERVGSLKAYGALQYRLGLWPQACQSLRETLADAGPNSMVEAWLFYAMAQFRSGHAQEANYWAGKARAWVRGAVFENSGLEGGYQLPWERRVDLSILSAETEKLAFWR